MALISLWEEATYDADAALLNCRLAQARAAVAGTIGALTKSASHPDLANRKALHEAAFDEVCAKVAEGDPAGVAVLRAALDDSISLDFDVVLAARQAEEQRRNAPRAAARHQAEDHSNDLLEGDKPEPEVWSDAPGPESDHSNDLEGGDHRGPKDECPLCATSARYLDDPYWVEQTGAETACTKCGAVIPHGSRAWRWSGGSKGGTGPIECEKCGQSSEARFKGEVADEEFMSGYASLHKTAIPVKCNACGHEFNRGDYLDADKCPKCQSTDLRNTTMDLKTAAEGQERAARVTSKNTTLAQVQQYLPSNYHASTDPNDPSIIWISGRDSAGWTLDGYVIPRLASGLIFAEEVSGEGQGVTWASRHSSLADWSEGWVKGYEARSLAVYASRGHMAHAMVHLAFADEDFEAEFEAGLDEVRGFYVPASLRRQGKDYDQETRDKMAESGAAMSDGSFPIADCGDAMDAVHRAHQGSNPEAAKAHVRKRWKALGCEGEPFASSESSKQPCCPECGKTAAMMKGAPFADYKDFADCVSKNQQAEDPEAYCGKIKHQVEDSKTAGWMGDWAAGLDAALGEMKSAKTPEAVIAILNKYASPSSGDAFWSGDGDDMLGVLLDAGWSIHRYNAPYYWVIKAPGGGLLSYTEGDVSSGDNPSCGAVEASKTSASKTAGYEIRLASDWGGTWTDAGDDPKAAAIALVRNSDVARNSPSAIVLSRNNDSGVVTVYEVSGAFAGNRGSYEQFYGPGATPTASKIAATSTCGACGAPIHSERFLGQEFWCTGSPQPGVSPSRQSTDCPAAANGQHWPFDERKRHGLPPLESHRKLAARSLSEIAAEIRADWSKVYFGAVPYLDAMGDLDSINDHYGMDDGSSIVAYFLSNATTWRGETARRVKAELNAMLKQVYGARIDRLTAEAGDNPFPPKKEIDGSGDSEKPAEEPKPEEEKSEEGTPPDGLQPGDMQPGQQVLVHYVITGDSPSEGDTPATFESFDGTQAIFSYDKGRFGVTQGGAGKWLDAVGTEFSFTPQAAPTEPNAPQPTDPAQLGQQPPQQPPGVPPEKKPFPPKGSFKTAGYQAGDSITYRNWNGEVRSVTVVADPAPFMPGDLWVQVRNESGDEFPLDRKSVINAERTSSKAPPPFPKTAEEGHWVTTGFPKPGQWYQVHTGSGEQRIITPTGDVLWQSSDSRKSGAGNPFSGNDPNNPFSPSGNPVGTSPIGANPLDSETPVDQPGTRPVTTKPRQLPGGTPAPPSSTMPGGMPPPGQEDPNRVTQGLA
jgi:hypothetical protein